MNFPQTVDELIHWDISTGEDSFGNYTIITGFEGTGGCFWCGKGLEGRRRRFCGHHSGHWTLYAEHFYWSSAKSRCLERYEYRCANCGIEQPKWNREAGGVVGCIIEAHHIIPLEGKERVSSPYNVPWNLISFCHVCHQLIHATLRQARELLATPDLFDLALVKGQAVFEALR